MMLRIRPARSPRNMLYNHTEHSVYSSATRTRWRTLVMVYLLFVSGFAHLYRRISANLFSPPRKSSLRLSIGPMWKSWIAMLCVALIAFVTLESVSPAHAAADPCFSTSTGSTIGEESNIVADVAEDSDGSPLEQQQQQQRHHCCGAHASSTPPLAHAGAPVQLAGSLVPARPNDTLLDNAPTGLERPPKATAIV